MMAPAIDLANLLDQGKRAQQSRVAAGARAYGDDAIDALRRRLFRMT